MKIKKLAPWNWFKKEEEEDTGRTLPANRHASLDPGMELDRALASFHREFDRLFDRLIQGFGRAPLGFDRPAWPFMAQTLLKPTVDIGSAENEYTVTVEVPGVSEDDVKIELAGGTLTIHGEKKRENSAKDKNYYCVERSYGAFRRVLSLPRDVDRDNIQANFKNGVLTITMPRKSLPKSEVKRIDVKKAA
jgi:HSP20 family protein